MFTSVRVVSFQRLSWASWTPWQSIKIHSPQFVSFRRTSTQERTLEMIDERVVFYISLCASLFLLGKEKARPRFFFVALSTNIDISKRWTHRTTLSDRIRWRKDGGGGYRGDRMRAHRLNTTGSKETHPPLPSPGCISILFHQVAPSLPHPAQTALQSFLSRLGTRTPSSPSPSSSFSVAFHPRSRIIRLLLSYARSIPFRVFLFFSWFFFFALPSLPPLPRIISSGTKFVGQEGGFD